MRKIWKLVKTTFSQWRHDQAPQMAAALAYYTIFSLAPLLIIVIAIAGTVFGEKVAKGELVMQLEQIVGKEATELIRIAVENTSQVDANQGIIPTLINIGVLLFGATIVFGQLQTSLNKIWEVKPKPGNSIKVFLRKRLLSFSMVLVIAFLLLVSLVVSTVLVIISNFFRDFIPGFTYLWEMLNLFVSFSLATLLFGLIYKVLPDAKIAWRDVGIGAVITAILFEFGKFLLGWYLRQTGLGSAYGAAGSLIVILTWVFYSAQILFLGAEFTKVYAQSYGKKIIPARYAMRISNH